MDIKCYLAMTAAEFFAAKTLPQNAAWMACHFSCYGTGLSNLPPALPDGSMIIVNDRTPPSGHDPDTVLSQLRQLTQTQKTPYVLLDLQRPDMEETAKIAQLLTKELDCQVGVSEYYAKKLDCPVFLRTPLPWQTLRSCIDQWSGREIWLEIATEAQRAAVTSTGCTFTPHPVGPLPPPNFTDKMLHCRYRTEVFEDRAEFTIQRDAEELRSLMEESGTMGVRLAVGLYQQLGTGFFNKEDDVL